MIKLIRNFIIYYKYPFLRIKNHRNSKEYLTMTLYDSISKGWQKSFGKEFCNALRKQLKEEKLLKSFRILDIKQKYGTLRIFGCTTTSSKVLDIISYYENLSVCYCENCGRKARYVTRKGWIQYLCKDCYNEYVQKHPYYDSNIYIDRLNTNDLLFTFENKYIYKEINYAEMWGLNINDKK